ncbi:MAG: hypothetical protein M3Q48_12690 [Actinomycetota bacterium]|nr:hypothetical protein [Actinomycetota bacterium]
MKDIAAEGELGQGVANRAIAEVEALHYQVEVNKRGLSVTALTKTLNDRWENGWRLAHMLEQRGNTVLVFEKRYVSANCSGPGVSTPRPGRIQTIRAVRSPTRLISVVMHREAKRRIYSPSVAGRFSPRATSR